MAIGSDRALSPVAKPQRPTLSPARSPAQSRRYSGAVQVNDNAVSDAANNRLAAGVGAGYGAVREMDKAGVSRGKGQQYVGEFAEAASDAEARGDVAKMEMGVAQQDAMARQQFDNMKKNERLNTEGLLEQLRSNQAQERLARQGWGLDAYETLRRGQWGLDQMQLNMSPLWQRLFS